MKILLVEDNARLRADVKDTLAGTFPAANEIVECDRGEAAIQQYHLHQPDWVVMDIQLEGMDGLWATKQIMGLDPSAQVIIFTQYDDPVYRRAATVAGAKGFVLKENIRELSLLLGSHGA